MCQSSIQADNSFENYAYKPLLLLLQINRQTDRNHRKKPIAEMENKSKKVQKVEHTEIWNQSEWFRAFQIESNEAWNLEYTLQA